MSWSIALRRSPKPGALTATALKVPRSLLTMIVARASPSRSSAMIKSGLLIWTTFSKIGSRSATAETLRSVIRMYGSSSTASIRWALVTM